MVGVAPGLTLTSDWLQGEAFEQAHALSPLGRSSTPEDVAATIEKVTDLQAILAHDILSTPALVINGQVVASGRIPTQAEIQQWLTP